ncbi:autotransporter domain-containing protein [Rhodoligotrophos ferricapiens]|uniref:autotransporter domain-containing protein n=1 Tax=Rhodoligotrophos ferricapiens TaxID=3069264 RepID=UPI00315D6BAE
MAAQSTAPEQFTYINRPWIVGRYKPHSQDVLDQYQGRKSVLKIGVGESGFAHNREEDEQGTFHDYQGYSAQTNLTADGKDHFISGNLYVPQEWQTAPGAGEDDRTGVYQAPALWGNLSHTQFGNVAWPVIGFSNKDGVGKVMVWDDQAGVWNETDATVRYGEWNNMRVVYAGDQVYLMVNDQLVSQIDLSPYACGEGVEACIDHSNTTFTQIILTSYNNGTEEYDAYWANILEGEAVLTNDIAAGSSFSKSVLLDGNGAFEGGDGVIAIGDNTHFREALQVVDDIVVNFGKNVAIDQDLFLTDGATTVGGEGGAVTTQGDVYVDNTSTLGGEHNITGDLMVDGTVSPGGTIDKARDAGIINTNGNYVANTATAVMDVDFGATQHVAGTTYDQINITGDVSGTTVIKLEALNDSEAGPVGDLSSVELITVGGDLPANAFTLDGRYFVGAREIFLDPRAGDDGLVIGLDAVVANESYVFSSLPATIAMAGDLMLGRFVDRRGYDWANAPRGWARTFGGGFNIDRTTGVGIDSSVVGVLTGLDIVALPGFGNARVGIQAGYGYVSSDVKRRSGAAGSDDLGSTANMTAVGAYFTQADHNYFADLTVQYRFIDMDSSLGASPSASIDGHAVDVAGEVGYIYPFYPGVAVVPTAQLVYQNVHFDKYSDPNFDVRFGGNDALVGRVNVAAITNLDGITAYGGFGVAGNLLGAMETRINGEVMKHKIGSARAELSAGLQADLASGVSFLVSGEYGIGFSGNVETYLGKAALQVSF